MFQEFNSTDGALIKKITKWQYTYLFNICFTTTNVRGQPLGTKTRTNIVKLFQTIKAQNYAEIRVKIDIFTAYASKGAYVHLIK